MQKCYETIYFCQNTLGKTMFIATLCNSYVKMFAEFLRRYGEFLPQAKSKRKFLDNLLFTFRTNFTQLGEKV